MGMVGQAAMRVQTVKGVQAWLRQQHAVRLEQRPVHRTGWQRSRCLQQNSRSSSSSSNAQPAATLPQLTAASSRGSWQLASCKGACRRLLLLLLECRSSSTRTGARAAQRHNSCNLQHLQHNVSMQRLAANMQAAPRRVHVVLSSDAG